MSGGRNQLDVNVALHIKSLRFVSCREAMVRCPAWPQALCSLSERARASRGRHRRRGRLQGVRYALPEAGAVEDNAFRDYNACCSILWQI